MKRKEYSVEELRRARDEILGTAYGRDQCHESTMRLACDAINRMLEEKEHPEQETVLKDSGSRL